MSELCEICERVKAFEKRLDPHYKVALFDWLLKIEGKLDDTKFYFRAEKNQFYCHVLFLEGTSKQKFCLTQTLQESHLASLDMALEFIMKTYDRSPYKL